MSSKCQNTGERIQSPPVPLTSLSLFHSSFESMGYHTVSSITLVSAFKLMLNRVILCCLQLKLLTNKEISPWKCQMLKCE